MARTSKPADDDPGAAYRRGDIDLAELNARAAAAGAAATTAPATAGLEDVTTAEPPST